MTEQNEDQSPNQGSNTGQERSYGEYLADTLHRLTIQYNRFQAITLIFKEAGNSMQTLLENIRNIGTQVHSLSKANRSHVLETAALSELVREKGLITKEEIEQKQQEILARYEQQQPEQPEQPE